MRGRGPPAEVPGRTRRRDPELPPTPPEGERPEGVRPGDERRHRLLPRGEAVRGCRRAVAGRGAGSSRRVGAAGRAFRPIGDLYKTQVREMARHLGVPPRILDKVPSAGLWKGQTDEGELGIPYEGPDRVLLGIEVQFAPGA